MRILSAAIGLMGVATMSQAQTTVTNSIFPTAGAILQISTTTNVAGYTVTPPSSSAQSWDFSQLSTETYREDEILDAASGAAFTDFPNTEVRQNLLPGLGGTAYVDVTANTVRIIGGGIDLMGFAFVEPYDDPHQLQVAPLNYNTIYNDDFQVTFGEHIDSVPFLRQLIDSLGSGMIPNGISPDSIRINVEGERRTKVDAFGTLTAYDGNYDVLRQQVREYTEVKIEVRVDPGFFPAFWFDVTSMLTGAIPLPIPTNDTTYYYDYLADGYQQPIVRLNMNGTGTTIESIEFKGQNSVGVTMVEMQNPMRLYPNPTTDVVMIEMGDFATRTCQLQLVALDGKVLKMQTVSNVSNLTLSLSDLPAGLYALVVRDEQGTLLRTERVEKQ